MQTGIVLCSLGKSDILMIVSVVIEYIVADSIGRQLRNRGSCRNIRVTCGSPTGTQLELIEYPQFLDEFLIAKIPCKSERRECAPAATLTKV